jgi:hypothetical protein
MKGLRIKLKNRRVSVYKGKNDLVLEFVTLQETPPSIVAKSNRNRHVTALSLSYDGAIALHKLLGESILLSDLVNNNLIKDDILKDHDTEQ